MSNVSLKPPSWATHPWTLIAIEIGLLVFIVGFTKPSSPGRRAFLPVFIYLVYAVATGARTQISNSFHASFGTAYATLTLLQYVDVALLSKWDFVHGGPSPRAPTKKIEKPFSKTDNLWNRLSFGIYAAASYRCSGTSFEVPNLAPFDPKNLNYVPSHAKYMRWALFRVVVVYFVLDALTSFNDPAAMAPLFTDEKIPLLARLSQLTLQESVTRTITSFSFWFVNYLVLMLFFDIPGIICVSTGLSGVEWWRPPFNNITEAYTLRRYWGVFWHQSVRKRINHPASFITYSMLNMHRGSLLARYVALAFTFVISSCQHTLGDVASGIPISRTGSPWFFMIQALGFVMEDIVQKLWSWLSPASGGTKPARWRKVVGFVWVFLWMFWCTPFYSYPVSANNRGEKDAILPFSILKMLTSKV